MKEHGILLKSMLLLNLLVLLLTLTDFLALHDIQNDYVSTKVFEDLKISISAPLPTWAAAQGEWQILSISFWMRALFLLANLILLWQIGRNLKTTYAE